MEQDTTETGGALGDAQPMQHDGHTAAEPFADAGPPKGLVIAAVSMVAILLLGGVVWAAVVLTTSTQPTQGVAVGDEIEYDYVLRYPDGLLFSTSILSLAEKANETEGFALDGAAFGTQRATVDPFDPGLPWGHAADEALVGAKVGGRVRLSIEDPNLTGSWSTWGFAEEGIRREVGPQPFSRVLFLQEPDAAAIEGNPGTPGFTLDDLEELAGMLYDGFVFTPRAGLPPSGDILVEDVNHDNRSVVLRLLVEDGQYFEIPGIQGGMTAFLRDNETTLWFRWEWQRGTTFAVEPDSPAYAAGFSVGSYRVAALDDAYVRLEHSDRMDPARVGSPLELEIRIRRIVAAQG